jgi:hypothetical protein
MVDFENTTSTDYYQELCFCSQMIPLKVGRSNSNSAAIDLIASNSSNANGIAPPKQCNTIHTISNSSLQDLDQTEFTGKDLASYMGELNNR